MVHHPLPVQPGSDVAVGCSGKHGKGDRQTSDAAWHRQDQPEVSRNDGRQTPGHRGEADDFVVSTDAISSTLWSNDSPSLSAIFTSSAQVADATGNYYINIYNSAATSSVQFAVAYGNSNGSGSLVYNSAVNGLSPTSTIFGQWQDLVIGDENTNFTFGAITSSEFFALTFERARYKDALFLGSLSLTLSASGGSVTLTDNSAYVTAVQFTEAGRVFQLITGSTGVISAGALNSNGFSANSGSYGWLLPDIGTILINPKALGAPAISGGIAFTFSGSATSSAAPNISPNQSLFVSLSSSLANLGASADFSINAQETLTSDFIFVRPRSTEYNYSFINVVST